VALAFSEGGTHLLSAGGKVAAWWEVATRKLVRSVRGPQELTAAVLSSSGGRSVAYFGTRQGSVVSWDPSQSRAVPMPNLACVGYPAPPGASKMPEARRCPYGNYFVADTGQAVCVYPVTALALEGAKLIRACREGSLYMQELPTGKRTGFSPGHLEVVVPVDAGLLLLGRAEGELRLYDLASKELRRELEPPGPPLAAAAAGDLVAVAQPGAVRVWSSAGRTALYSWPERRRVVWVGLRRAPAELRVLTADGELASRALTVTR